MKLLCSGFVLGAGLGTRLRPLTSDWPKPLIPVFQKPLISFAMDHLISVGVKRFAVNTHHAADAYQTVFPDSHYRGYPVEFRHENPVLETGGGIKNLEDWIGSEPLLVYNGDILSDLPLEPAIEEHFSKKNVVTLVLRSGGGSRRVAWDSKRGLVTDLRNGLGTNSQDLFLFTGIYLISPEFLAEIPANETISVVPIWLKMIQEGRRVGAVVEDRGLWRDLGNREELLSVHQDLPGMDFPAYSVYPEDWRVAIHPSAVLEEGAVVRGSTVGEGVRIRSGATVMDSIVWPGAEICGDADLKKCVVRHGKRVGGVHENRDL